MQQSFVVLAYYCKWQHDLSVSYERIGDMHKANGDGDKAINAYRDSLKIAEKLAKRDPNNVQLLSLKPD